MTGREKMLLDAVEGMEHQYSSYQDEVVRHLISDESTSGREDRLLKALVIMVDQLLQRNDGQVDTVAESAGEYAVEALADLGWSASLLALDLLSKVKLKTHVRYVSSIRLMLECQPLAAARGGFFASATAIAEISGRMKKASSAG
jgi:hypothetical protein